MKTASSTTVNILYRYGIKHNLTAPPGPLWIYPNDNGTRLDINKYTCSNFTGFDYIANDIRYNRPLMEDVIPNAKYFTILRDNYTRLESVFNFFNCGREMDKHAIASPFMHYIQHSFNFSKQAYPACTHQRRNGMMWTLALDYGYQDNDTAIQLKIDQLDQTLDLVMLAEYYDESLILLKKIMCWKEDDILYYSINVRRNKLIVKTISPEIKNTIAKYNKADILLYQHFNRTFWEKVESYDGHFDEDLKRFRSRLDNVSKECSQRKKPTGISCWQLHAEVPPLRQLTLEKQLERWNC
ncbi:galactosylceramide sulfotransferase-like [Saccoglossus kowalevskii]